MTELATKLPPPKKKKNFTRLTDVDDLLEGQLSGPVFLLPRGEGAVTFEMLLTL